MSFGPFLLVLVSASCAEPGAPRFISATSAVPASPYRLQVGDQLSVRLFYTPELNEEVTVRPDGRVTTTLAESVPAAGRTPEELAAALRVAYAAELKDPRVTVEVKSAAPVRVYVTGEVPQPGEIVANGPPPTLVQALARAGGLRVTGDPDRVLILRHLDGDRARVIDADYASAVSGRNPAADLPLQPFDIVVVPRTSVAEVYVWVNQHIQQFVPVSWGFSYSVNPVVNNNTHA